MSKKVIYLDDAIDAVGSMLRRKFGIGSDLAEITLAGLSPAQPEPKKGEWILMSDADGEYYACSECGEELPYCSETPTWDKPYPRKQSIDKTDFCPNCGADMRGKNNGKTT